MLQLLPKQDGADCLCITSKQINTCVLVMFAVMHERITYCSSGVDRCLGVCMICGALCVHPVVHEACTLPGQLQQHT